VRESVRIGEHQKQGFMNIVFCEAFVSKGQTLKVIIPTKQVIPPPK
jgi:hypothetical protein